MVESCRRLASHRLPAWFEGSLVRNGYSLVASVGITSLLGMAYWLLAARLYSAEDVGLNAALISTMTALSAFAQLNLGSVLTRFLPDTGRSAPRWILGAYALGAAASIVSCIVFFLGAEIAVPTLRFVADEPWLAVWFVGGTIVWTVFALQDGALTGLRSAIWIPIENAVFAVAKIALLVVFAGTGLHAFGLFASWTIPLLALVIPINLLIFRWILPASQPGPHHVAAKRNLRTVSHFLGGDFLGSSFFYVAAGMAPILVLESAGAAANAHYYLAWTITYSLYLVSKVMGASLTAEGAANREDLQKLAWRTLTHTMVMLAIGVAVVLAAAPSILALFGPDYAREGVSTLRILSLSAIPFGYISVYLGVARVQGRMAAVAGIQGAMMALVLGLGIPLLGAFGTVGISIAWLLAQASIAVALLAIGLFHSERHNVTA